MIKMRGLGTFGLIGIIIVIAVLVVVVILVILTLVVRAPPTGNGAIRGGNAQPDLAIVQMCKQNAAKATTCYSANGEWNPPGTFPATGIMVEKCTFSPFNCGSGTCICGPKP